MRTEDPLFDPWGGDLHETEVEPLEDDPAEDRASRWTLRPLQRPAVPRPRPSPSVRAQAPPAREGIGDLVPASAPPPHDPTAALLRSRVLPVLLRVAAELRAARHEVTVDDRGHHEEPSLRFQLRPRRGPFDPQGRAAPVLELVVTGGPDDEECLEARIWPEPLASSPALVRTVPGWGSDEGAVQAIVHDFVAHTLQLT